MNGLEPPSTPLWVDMHCHLDLQADHAGLIAECDRERVATLAVTTTPKAWRRNRALAAGSRHVRAALKPTGRLGIIDRDGSGGDHGVRRDDVVREAARAGLRLAGEYDFVKPDGEDYFLVFEPAG